MRRKRLIKATAVMAAVMCILSVVLMCMDVEPAEWFMAWFFFAAGAAWLTGFIKANWNTLMEWLSR